METPDIIHFQNYYNTVDTYDQNGFVIANCAQISFYNLGTSNVTLLGLPLAPKQGIAFSGNDGELDITKYTFYFSGAGNNMLVVISKNYPQNANS